MGLLLPCDASGEHHEKLNLLAGYLKNASVMVTCRWTWIHDWGLPYPSHADNIEGLIRSGQDCA